MRILQCKLTTIEAMLGTASNNKELHSEFIASHAPDAPSREEEIEAVGVEEVIEKGMTVFSRNKDGQPILWDYQIKGFFKDACGVLRKVKGTKSAKSKPTRRKLTGLFLCRSGRFRCRQRRSLQTARDPCGRRRRRARETALRAARRLRQGLS